jgi:short-subunit dehydrogenase
VTPPGAVVVLSAVVADFPTAGMAAYSASKAGLSAYLAALRRERRRDGLVVLDVRPQHLDTPFAERALAGSPPPLKAGSDPDEVAAAILQALRDDKRELAYDLKARALVAS